MKVIDIMQKVANKEKFRFRIDDYNFYVDKSNYICDEDGEKVEWCIDDEWLNMNAEIIEEEKKIPKKLDMVLLGQCDNWTQKYNKDTQKMESTHIELNPYVIDIIRENTLEIQHEFNEIIDYLDYLKSKGE